MRFGYNVELDTSVCLEDVPRVRTLVARLVCPRQVDIHCHSLRVRRV
jgi:hypothetical protein